ncbi:MAG TPA: flagellar filament capping protein FliD [Chitinispirillaceae bacterium]|nr:flagellar filament capping protein FliD [Chitinispirillaceae bacterium]
MGISVNGPSGIDTTSLIEQLVELEQTNKITPVEEKIDKYEKSLSAYSKVSTLITDLGTKAKAIDEVSDFNCYEVTSTDDECATISGSTNCQPGNYALRIFHTAAQEKLVSSNNLISSQTSSLSSQGINSGTFSINGVEISIDDDDTIQDLRSKINGATDEDGGSIGVTATVVKLSSDNFRLVLTAAESGSSGASYTDVNGSVLQDLGIITNPEGDKGVEHQQYTSNENVRDMFSLLSEDESIRISGSDHDGNTISKQIVISRDMSENDALDAITSAFNGTISVSFTEDGQLQATDLTGGESSFELSFTSFGDLSAPSMEQSQSGYTGGNVLSCGSNAFFNIDGMSIMSESNDVEDVIVGATIHLNKADPDKNVNVGIDIDTDKIKQKITDFVDSYNAVRDYVKSATARADSEDEDSVDGDLAGDSTVSQLLSNISSAIRQQFNTGSGVFKTLSSIGITTDYSSGNFTVDDDKLNSAIKSNLNDLVSFFTTSGSSGTSGVTLGRYTSSTTAGQYEIEKNDDNTYRIRVSGSSQWYTSDSALGELVKFSEGPAAGLSLTIQSDAVQSGDTVSFKFYKGFGDTLETLCDKLTSTKTGSEGVIKQRTASIQRNIDYSNDRLDLLNERIEKYRERLVKQYASMEKALNTMQTQMTDLLSSISSSSSS